MGTRNSVLMGLLDAAYALEEKAAGRTPEFSRVLSGAITLDTLFRRGSLDADLQDAALILERVVTEGTYRLDERGSSRAARLALKARGFANRYIKTPPHGG